MAYRSAYANSIHGRTSGGSRSKYEDKLKLAFSKLNIAYVYEPKNKDGKKIKIPYIIERNYEPDFIMLANFFLIEGKGYLDYDNQQKLKALKKSNPWLQMGIAFQNAYGKVPLLKMQNWQWAEKYGFLWSHDGINSAWEKLPLCVENKRFMLECGYEE